MRKTVFLLAALSLLCLLLAAASADPLTLADDLSGAVYLPEGSDASNAAYIYTYSYPQVLGDGETEESINSTYAYVVDYDLQFTVPAVWGERAMDGSSASATTVSYRITANNDEYFSVLIITDTTINGERNVSVQAQVFSRVTTKAGHIITMPFLLGILKGDEDDDWLRERQTERADTVIRELIWSEIQWRKSQGETFPEDLTEEALEYELFPEEEFYYDGETGYVVFFLQPYMNGEGMAPDEFYTFEFDFEDILDEM